MKILHFYRTYYPDSFGGVEQVIRQMMEGSSRIGVDAELLTLTRNKNASQFELEFEGHKVHRAPLNVEIASTGFSWAALSRFKELAQEADVIHYHFPWPFMDIAHFLCGIHQNKPTVVTYHSDIVRQKNLLKLYQPLMNCFLNSVDKIVATSPNYLATSPVLTRYKEKTEIITYGLNQDVYATPEVARVEKWRTQFPTPFFLFVGMLRYYKGLHILLEAAQGTNFPILMMGNGPVEQDLKQQAHQYGLTNVHFLGALPEEDKIALLSLCYAVAFPSHLRSEAFGITLLEAAMYGKPMISCEIGTGTSFVNIDQKTGLVVPPNDASAFRNAMQYLISHPEEAAMMGQNAGNRFQEMFTAQKMATSYKDLYQRVIDQKLMSIKQ